MCKKEYKCNIKKMSTFLLFVIFFILLFNVMVFASDENAIVNAKKFGIITLLPPFLAIALAFWTRNVVLSLFIGVFSGTFILELNGFNIISAIIRGYIKLCNEALTSLSNPWNAGIILQCLAIGGMIALISKMGGAKAIAEMLSKKANTAASAQFVTWLLGLLIFFDDYANSLTVGPIMRPVTDKMKVSREKLAFIIDSTAAPISGIALISTWIAFEIGLIKDGYNAIGIDASAYTVFVGTIPFRFYNILILFFIVCTIFFLREFGPMYKAEMRARRFGKVLSDNAKPMISEEAIHLSSNKNLKSSVWYAIIPLGVLIISAFLGFYFDGYKTIMGGEDISMLETIKNSPLSFEAIWSAFGASNASIVLFQAALLAGIVALFIAISKRILSLEEAITTWIFGVKSLNITAVILILAWSLSSVMKELGTASYLVAVFSEKIPIFILPSVVFLFGAIISFATGTSYGTMGILMPLTIPLAYTINPENTFMLINISAVLTGAIFGDHCSPISDTTILSSMGSACDHIDHTKTQLFYAMPVALIAIICGYIPAGLGISLLYIFPLTFLSVVCLVYFVGKPMKI